MRTYELIMLMDPRLADEEVLSLVEDQKKMIATGGAEVVKEENWGKRKLAYPIDKKEQGIYAILRYETEPSALTEFERIMRLDEQVLRQLTVVDPIIAAPPAVRAPRPIEDGES